MYFDAYPEIFARAYNLRQNMTKAELLLWEQLRKNKLGVRFKPQHPMKYFIADFYCYALKLVIELDGPIHLLQKEKDEARTKELVELGNTVIRFKNEEVINNLFTVLEEIKMKIEELRSIV